MEEKKLQWFTATKWVLRTAGMMILLIVINVVVAGIKDSQGAHGMIEQIHKSRAGLENAYPVEGVDYDLEARVADNTDPNWYRGVIAADFGDYVEVRLRIASKNQEDISPRDLSFMSTNGFVATELDSQSLVSGQHISYIPVGTYQFGRKDWYDGNPVSTLHAYCKGNTVDELLLMPPYGELDIVFVITLSVIALAVGIIGPIIVSAIERRKA